MTEVDIIICAYIGGVPACWDKYSVDNTGVPADDDSLDVTM